MLANMSSIVQPLYFVALFLSAQLAWAHTGNATVGADFEQTSPFLIPLRRDSVPLRKRGIIVSYKSMYSGTISVGTPKRDFSVVFDTGSGHVILPSTSCTSETCLQHRRYDMKTSSTATAINEDGSLVIPSEGVDEVSIGFGTGEVTGQFMRENVCLGPSIAPGRCVSTHAVVASEMSEKPFKSFSFDGIFGLGLQSLSLSPKFNIMQALADNGLPPRFGVHLTDSTDGAGSEIAIGGFNSAHMASALSWVPVAHPEMGFWQIEITAVRIGGETLELCKGSPCYGIIDTGSSHIGLPSKYDQLLDVVMSRPSLDLSDCRDSRAPTLEIDVPGFTIKLDPSDYMRPLPLKKDDVLVAREQSLSGAEVVREAPVAAAAALAAAKLSPRKDTKWCRPKVMPVSMPKPLSSNTLLLGEPMLRRYYTAFDAERRSVGFSLAAAPAVLRV